MEGNQVLPTDPVVAGASKELATIGTLFSALTNPREINILEGANPSVEMHVIAGGHEAQMSVIDRESGHMVAMMAWYKATGVFDIALFNKATGIKQTELSIRPDGHVYINGDKLLGEGEVESLIREFRTTVPIAIAGSPITRAECITAFKILPHFDWAKDDDYYCKDTSGGNVKLYLVKYRANGATDEASAGTFWFEKLTEAS
jgi:hypothetical protein